MKKFQLAILTLSVAVLGNAVLLAQPQVKVEAKQKISVEVIIGTKTASPAELNLMKVEELKHPNIAKAMTEIKSAIKTLNDAPENFGGHKKEALQDLEKSYVSLRKALYFRLWEDTH